MAGRSGSRRWFVSVLVLVLLAGALYVAGLVTYGAVLGANEYLAGTPKATGCATPMSRFGWEYEPINYDIKDDIQRLADNPDPTNCTSQGSAGNDVRSEDGTRLAGWFIPAVTEHDWKQPVVVIVHGGKSNKSAMLEYAPPFHERYDVVILDLRNSGASDEAFSTGGLHEQDDIEAMLEWIAEDKTLFSAVLVGNSNGAAASLAAAASDQRVAGLILDSMHASAERQLGNVIQTERGLPAWPGAWAVVAGVSARVGEPLESVDPARKLREWNDRPILFTHGSADIIDRPSDSLDVNVAVASEVGIPYEVRVCEGAGHGRVIETCRDDWTRWVQRFMALPSVTLQLSS